MHGLTHVEGGPDPIPGLPEPAPGGDTIDAVIAGLDPAGFWKLNESSGHVAADSSGNGQDLSTSGSELDPLWGAPAGPPGTQAADFENGTGSSASRVSRSWPPITASFTTGIWVNRTSTNGTMVIGQGNPGRAGGKGWQLMVLSSSFSPANTPRALMATGVSVDALNPLPPGTWAFLAVAYDAAATHFKLYVNGLLEGTSSSFTYVPVTSASPFWIGHDGGLGGYTVDPAYFIGSYAFYVPGVLTGTQLLEVYNSALFPGGADDGKVLLTNGLGASYWDFPLEVSY